MSTKALPTLLASSEQFIIAKDEIVRRWLDFEPVERILAHHHIVPELFLAEYAQQVFDHFIDIITGRQVIGDCPVMAKFLDYLKARDVTAEELFVICSHLRRSMLRSAYDADIQSRTLLEEIGDIFDMNFTGVLKMYSERIYEKEQELQKSLKLLNEYKNAIDAGAIVSKANMDGIITYASENLTKLCGYSREELIGRSHNILRHPDMPDLFFADLWDTIRKKKVFKGTIKNRKKNGEHFYLDSTIVPIVDPDEKIVEYMAIGYEVTTLIDARQQAVDAASAKEYFLSNMSHEIRTPLNAILGFVTLLKEESTSPRHRKYLDIIHNSGENLLSIINDILDFSKLRSGEFTVERRSFDLHDELSQTLELFMPIAQERSISFLSFIDPSIPSILVSDALRIKQILANLLSNAIKFSPVQGRVMVEVTYSDGRLVISVTDEGIGIAQEDQEKVFSAFLQSHDSEGYVYGGTGLGLSICRQLANHMDGEISVSSSLGEGSVFTLTLPVETDAMMAEICANMSAVDALDVAFLSQDIERDEVILLRRYLDACKVDVQFIEDIEDADFDLLIFVESSLQAAQRRRLLFDEIPSIAIMQTPKDEYGPLGHVVPLAQPFYTQKILKAMLEVLHLEDTHDPLKDPKSQQRRFIGSLLVAEDNAANQELIKILLQRYGLAYDVVSDGMQALERFTQKQFDMVLMDEQMPKMNGRDAMLAMGKHEIKTQSPHTPVVALTANVMKGARERGLSAGYDAFLGKPIIIKELESVFAQFLVEDLEASRSMSGSLQPPVVDSLDKQRLLKTLMLTPEQLEMLLDVFAKKMAQELPALEGALERDDLEGIAMLAHSIKGSSANFRLRSVQKLASSIEEAALHENRGFDHAQASMDLKKELQKVITLPE